MNFSSGTYLQRPCHSKLGKNLCCLLVTIKNKNYLTRTYRRLQARGFIIFQKLQPKVVKSLLLVP